MSLTLDEPLIKNVCHSNIHTNSKHAPETYQTWKEFYAKQPIPNQNSCSLEDNIHVSILSVLQKTTASILTVNPLDKCAVSKRRSANFSASSLEWSLNIHCRTHQFKVHKRNGINPSRCITVSYNTYFSVRQIKYKLKPHHLDKSPTPGLLLTFRSLMMGWFGLISRVRRFNRWLKDFASSPNVCAFIIL